MLLKISGLIVLLAGIVLASIACYGFFGTSHVEMVLTNVARYQGNDFDSGRWVIHYRFYWTIWLIVAALSIIGGFLMILRRVVGLACFMLGVVFSLIYPFICKFSNLRAYQFETANDATVVILIFLLVLAAVELFCLVRKPVGS